MLDTFPPFLHLLPPERRTILAPPIVGLAVVHLFVRFRRRSTTARERDDVGPSADQIEHRRDAPTLNFRPFHVIVGTATILSAEFVIREKKIVRWNGNATENLHVQLGIEHAAVGEHRLGIFRQERDHSSPSAGFHRDSQGVIAAAVGDGYRPAASAEQRRRDFIFRGGQESRVAVVPRRCILACNSSRDTQTSSPHITYYYT